MPEQPSDVATVTYRRRQSVKLIGLLVVAAIFWLQPRIQTWLDARKSGSSESADVAVQYDSDPSVTTQRPGHRNRVIVKDVDEPQNRSSRSASVPEAGKLRDIGNNVFESTAGLRYLPGSADNHRLEHVMQHAKDDASKPIHGVFEGDRDQILTVIDEAYRKVMAGGRDVRSEVQNDRVAYTVNVGRKIGYVGGSEGERRGNPDCHYLRIILEDGNVIISAYPVKSF